METEAKSFVSFVEVLAYVWGIIAIIGIFQGIYLGLVPAKQKSDLLHSKRKFALIVAGLLFFLTLTLPAFMVYLMLFDEISSLIILLVVPIAILLVGLAASINSTRKLYDVQIKAIEARDLSVRLKNRRD
jgi:hypothetical protein